MVLTAAVTDLSLTMTLMRKYGNQEFRRSVKTRWTIQSYQLSLDSIVQVGDYKRLFQGTTKVMEYLILRESVL